jgi:hypothetical protein
MAIDVTLPRISEDEAYSAIASTLRHSPKAGAKVALIDIINQYIERYRPSGPGQYRFDPYQPNAAPFYSVAWRLCMRGVLAQAPALIQPNYGGMAGTHFIITEYGAKWLSGISDYDCGPTEYGRFSQLLSNHALRLGGGYHTRSQEAVSCYRAQTYLACCAMCGAAAESIMLALAIAKNGNEEAVIREYKSANGRSKIENIVIGQQKDRIKQEFLNFTSLLKYWRDTAAHGERSTIGGEEAFTSMLILLRFARFANENWGELTT